MKVDAIIFIEHVPRELYISELIKNKLQQYGLKVIIASMSYHKHKVLLNYKPKSIITPFIGFGKILYVISIIKFMVMIFYILI